MKKRLKKPKRKIIPSIIARDRDEMLKRIMFVRGQSKLLQLDIMDGKFVKNKSLWFDIVLPKNDLEYEAHLMVNHPNKWIRKNPNLAQTVIFHIETVKNPLYTINLIKSYGKRAGIAIHPKTSIKRFERYLPYIDQLVILMVTPGKYGSKFLPKMLEKVRKIRKQYPELDIEVDGGINNVTLRRALAAGANKFIVGSYLMKSEKTKDLKRRATILKQILRR